MESNAGGALEAVRGATGNVQATPADTLDAFSSRIMQAVIALGVGVLIGRASKR